MYSVLSRKEQAHKDGIWSVTWAKNQETKSEILLTGSVDNTIRAWSWDDSASALDEKWQFEGHQLGVVSVVADLRGNIAASSGLDGMIKIWNLSTGQTMKSIDGGPVDVWTVAFSPDSQHVATGSHNGKISLFSVEDGTKTTTLDTGGKFVLSIACSPNGKLIASGAIDGIINLFDLQTGQFLHKLEGHAMPVRSLCFSPYSQLLVTASDDKQMKIYDIRNANQLVCTLSGHSSWVLSVAFSPDNQHIVTGSSDKTVRIWDCSSRQCEHLFKEHNDQVWGVCFNDSGTRAASVADDQLLVIYNLPS